MKHRPGDAPIMAKERTSGRRRQVGGSSRDQERDEDRAQAAHGRQRVVEDDAGRVEGATEDEHHQLRHIVGHVRAKHEGQERSADDVGDERDEHECARGREEAAANNPRKTPRVCPPPSAAPCG